MAEPSFHFPSAEVMTNYLSKHPLLALDYYKEKGITQAVVELATKRFASSYKVEDGITVGASMIIYDLKNGEDGFTGEKITKINNQPPMFWLQLEMGLKLALKECANNASS